MHLNTPIALGFTAEIYAWNEGQVLKLFNMGISHEAVEYEAKLTQMVYASGLAVPAVGEIVEIEGRYGLVLERLDGITMLQAFIKKPWNLPVFARQLAELQAEMHQCHVRGMPSQREKLERKIRGAVLLSENVRQAALNLLELVPEDDKLCHGDFHPGNIQLTSRGPVIIDWIDASQGSPFVDVTRSRLLMEGGPLPTDHPMAWLIITLLRRWFYQIYLRSYNQLIPVDHQQISAWLPVLAAARLDENIHADEARLLSIAQRLVQKN